MHRQWHPRSSYLKKERQLVCSYLCTPCMLINPSVYLLLAFLFFVFSGMCPMVLALICSMLFTFRSVPAWLSQFSSLLCLSGTEPSISVPALYAHIRHDLKQVTPASPLNISALSSWDILRERQDARNDMWLNFSYCLKQRPVWVAF